MRTTEPLLDSLPRQSPLLRSVRGEVPILRAGAGTETRETRHRQPASHADHGIGQHRLALPKCPDGQPPAPACPRDRERGSFHGASVLSGLPGYARVDRDELIGRVPLEGPGAIGGQAAIRVNGSTYVGGETVRRDHTVGPKTRHRAASGLVARRTVWNRARHRHGAERS